MVETERDPADWLMEALVREEAAELRATFIADRVRLLMQRDLIDHALPQAEAAIAVADAALGERAS